MFDAFSSGDRAPAGDPLPACVGCFSLSLPVEPKLRVAERLTECDLDAANHYSALRLESSVSLPRLHCVGVSSGEEGMGRRH